MSLERSKFTKLSLLLLAFLCIIGIVIVIVLFAVKTYTNTAESWSIIVDAGSTASKLYLYRWNKSINSENSDILQVGAKQEIKVPISSFANNPSNASDAIAFTILNKDPFHNLPGYKSDRGPNLFLGATAGMRMLSYSNQNASTAIMESLQSGLSQHIERFSVLNPKSDVKIISGNEEGYFAWITANYLEGVLTSGSGNSEKQGILDLGGASTQISFVLTPDDASDGDITGDVTHKVIFGKPYDIYSHSYLCYGKTQANYRMIAKSIKMSNFTQSVNSPCLPKNFSLLVNAIDIFQAPCVFGKFALDAFGEEIDQPDNSPAHYEIVGTGENVQCLDDNVVFFFNSTSFQSVKKPNITGKFMAFAGYYYAISFAKLPSTITFDMLNAKIQQNCEGDGVARNVTVDDRAVWNCFDLIYIRELLLAYRFDSKTIQDIRFINDVNGQSVGWSIGFMLDQTSQLHEGLPIIKRILSTPAFIALLLLFIVFCIGCIGFYIFGFNKSVAPYN